MARTAATLYASGNAQVGDDEVWSNPNTGAFGLAEILAVEDNCVRVAYRFKTKIQSKSQTLTARRCLTNGRWVLSD